MQRNSAILAAAAALLIWLVVQVLGGGAGPATTEAIDRFGVDPSAPAGQPTTALALEDGEPRDQAIDDKNTGRAVVGASQGTSPKAAPPAPHHTRITGRTVDWRGTPIPLATVELLALRSPALDPDEVRERGLALFDETVIADAAGNFSLSKVPSASVLLLRASTDGLPAVTIPSITPLRGAARDLGDIRIDPAGLVRGFVTDEFGNGIGGATLWIARTLPGRLGWLGRWTPADELQKTAPDGSFEIADRAPGRFRLGAFAEGYAIAWTDELAVPSYDVESDLGQMNDVRISLQPGVRVAGIAVDRETGAPLEGVRIEANLRSQTLELVTDAEGRFDLPGCPLGTRLRYKAFHPGYRDQGGAITGARDGGTTPENRIEMQPAVTLRVRVLDEATGAPIAGARLHWTSLFGSDAATQEILRTGFGVTPEGVFATTDASGLGQAVVNDQALGLAVHADGFAPTFLDKAPYPKSIAEFEFSIDILMKRGASIDMLVLDAFGPAANVEVELRLATGSQGVGDTQKKDKRRPKPATESGVIKGLTIDASAGLMLVARTQTDSAGRASFDALPNGAWRVLVPGVAPREGDVGHAEIASSLLIIASASDHHKEILLLTQPGSFYGRVLQDGKPAAGQRVLAMRALDDNAAQLGTALLTSPLYVRHAKSDARGRYRIDGLSDGRWSLVAVLPSTPPSGMHPNLATMGSATEQHYNTSGVTLGIAPGESRPVDLVAQSRGNRLTGVVQVNSEARAGLVLTARLLGVKGTSLVYHAQSDQEGAYAFDGLTGGDWEISVQPARTKRGVQPPTLLAELIRMPQGRDLEANLFAQSTSLQVTLQLPDGAAKTASGWATLAPTDSSSGPIAANGTYAIFVRASAPTYIAAFPIGSYTATFRSRGFRAEPALFQTLPGVPEEVEIRAVAKEAQ